MRDSSASLIRYHVVRLNQTIPGEWYFPNGTTVLAQGSAISFYHNEGDDGTVTLNRINSDAISPTGLFCCVIPDATDTLQRVCATISKFQYNHVLMI